MERILIIGCGGAGKSTLARQLGEKTGLPVVHLDQLYWRGNWEMTPKEEFLQALAAEAQKDAWIIEGNNLRSMDLRLPYADTVFWFEFPPPVCLKNILYREWHYRGTHRPDLPEGCISRVDPEFLKYAWTFNQKNRQKIRELLKQAPHVQVIRFTSRRQVKMYLKSL